MTTLVRRRCTRPCTAEPQQQLIFSIAYRMLGSVADAEDVVQESLLPLPPGSDGGRRIESAKAYLASIATRLAHRSLALGARTAGAVCRHVAARADRRGAGARSRAARRECRVAVDGVSGDAGGAVADRASGVRAARGLRLRLRRHRRRSSRRQRRQLPADLRRAKQRIANRQAAFRRARARSGTSSRGVFWPRARGATSRVSSGSWRPTRRSTATAAARCRSRSGNRFTAATASPGCSTASSSRGALRFAVAAGSRQRPARRDGARLGGSRDLRVRARHRGRCGPGGPIGHQPGQAAASRSVVGLGELDAR